MTDRWNINKILSDKTRVSEASLEDTDRAHTYFFYTKIAELFEMSFEKVQKKVVTLDHAIVISSGPTIGETLSQRIVKVSPGHNLNIQQFGNLNSALHFLEISELDLNKAGISLPDLLLTSESSDLDRGC